MPRSASCGGRRPRWRMSGRNAWVPGSSPGTADFLVCFAIRKSAGWGGRIRTSDGGTKIRCLTPWLRPIRQCVHRSRAVQGKASLSRIAANRPSTTSPAAPDVQAPDGPRRHRHKVRNRSRPSRSSAPVCSPALPQVLPGRSRSPAAARWQQARGRCAVWPGRRPWPPRRSSRMAASPAV